MEGIKKCSDFGILNFRKGLPVLRSKGYVLKNSTLILSFLGAKEEAIL